MFAVSDKKMSLPKKHVTLLRALLIGKKLFNETSDIYFTVRKLPPYC